MVTSIIYLAVDVYSPDIVIVAAAAVVVVMGVRPAHNDQLDR